jgi:alpha-beta hydrolase superfamily lysophospholipase
MAAKLQFTNRPISLHALRRAALAVCTAAIVAYLAALALIFFRQEALLFAPVSLNPDQRFDFPGVSEVRVPVDGASLHALHFRQPNARGVVFFLHGNGGNVRTWLTSTEFYRRTGFDLFMLDYRGYGKSSGRIESEAQLHADVRAAWERISTEYAGRHKVIYGRSLGTGLAARLASEVDASLLVLVSPYTSLRDAARDHYPWIPGAAMDLILRYPMRTDTWLPRTQLPLLIVHGEHDNVIGIAHAQRLAALRPDAELLRLRQAGHDDVHQFSDYTETLTERFARL